MTGTTKTLVRRSLHDQIVELLGTRIVHGEFGATGALPTESVLAADLGVSRNALREAIKVLASKGLVEVRPKTGMRVLAREQWNLLDRDVLAWSNSSTLRLSHAFSFIEFRLIVEPKAARLAAMRATMEELETIDRNCSSLEACGATPELIAKVDLAFHRSVLLASHNAIINHLGSLVSSLMQLQVLTSTAPPGSFEKGLPLHRELANAILRRDPRQAEDASMRLVRMPYEELAFELGIAVDDAVG